MDIEDIDDLVNLDRKIPREDLEERKCFIDLLKGLLKINPAERWTATQAIAHPFLQGSMLDHFVPRPSKEYIEMHKSRSAPTGTLIGSYPKLLQNLRANQNSIARPGDVCFRPLVEELNEEFFTALAQKTHESAKKPPPGPSVVNVPNPFFNILVDFQHTLPISQKMIRPMPDIIGPRYTRPHSYEDQGPFPRPFSPSIEKLKNHTKPKKPNNTSQKNRSFSHKYNQSQSINLSSTQILNPTNEKNFQPINKPPNLPINNLNPKPLDPNQSGFLTKIKNQASQKK